MIRIMLIFLTITFTLLPQQKDIIYLSWNEVIDKTLNDNLSIKSKRLDYDAQNLEVWRAYSNFLPTVNYQGIGTYNIELPTIVFMGQKFTMGTKYVFQHSIDATLPVFTGGSRFFNVKVQSLLKKSLSEELKGKEEDAVLQTLQAYYGIILANELSKSSKEAVEVAESNLKQVKLFYEEGSATQLDLQRAQAQYYSTLPLFESAESNRILSYQTLKMLLDIDLNDSLVVTDSLSTKDFLIEFRNEGLNELKMLSFENSSELKAINYKFDATDKSEYFSISAFLPTIALSANLQHQAFSDEDNIKWKDFVRSKTITLIASWPLFEGGRRFIDYQLASIKTDQMRLLKHQIEVQLNVAVEQNYFKYSEAVKNLKSLKEAMEQSKESLRLSNLLYAEGMSTQLDVLNAQLLYNNSRVQYLQGIYNYNVIQLQLLKSIGKLNTIWN